MRSLAVLLLLILVSVLVFFMGNTVSETVESASAPKVGAEVIPAEKDPVPFAEQSNEREAVPVDGAAGGATSTAASPNTPDVSARSAAIPHVIAQLLEPSGIPLSEAAVDRSVSTLGRSSVNTIHTDKQGMVRFQIPNRYRNREELAVHFSWHDEKTRFAQSTLIQVPLPLEAITDLGVVPLTDCPVLVDGHVVDSAGNTIPKMHVQLNWRERPSLASDPEWRDRQSVSQNTTTDETGAFCFYVTKDLPMGGIELRVESGGIGFVPRFHIPVTLGDRDVRVIMSEGANLIGRARLDLPMVPLKTLCVTAEHKGESEWHGSIGQIVLPQSSSDPTVGDFELKGVPKGLCDVIFYLAPFANDPFFVIEDIDVPASGSVEDPRLRDVDLTFLYAIRVEVVDSEGRFIGGEIRLRRSGATTWPIMTVMSTDPARPGFVVAHPSVDIQIKNEGYDNVLLEGVTGDQRVVLQRSN